MRYLLLVMCTYLFAKKALTLHLARSEGHERYFGCNLMQRKVLASSHQHFNGGSTRNSTQNSRSALGTAANTDTKLLIYGLFQKGRVLAQDGVGPNKGRQRGMRKQVDWLCLLFIHPRAPNLIGLRSAGTMPT